jgi:transcription termination factor Rho
MEHGELEAELERTTAAPSSQDASARRHADYDRVKAAPSVHGRLLHLDERALLAEAQGLGLALDARAPREQFMQALVAKTLERQGLPVADGIIEVLPQGFGFLRNHAVDYMPSNSDIYVSPSQVRRFELRTGMHVVGVKRAAEEGERFTALLRVESVDGAAAMEAESRQRFDDLTPVHPHQRLIVEHAADAHASRLIDMFAPLGLGQRALIVAPPRAGKTLLLKELALGLKANQPWLHLVMLLVDERPEEVTDLSCSVPGEVVSSTFDAPPERHCHVARIVIERARRLVEQGRHVALLLDSITRLARAHNAASPNSGRILSGGVDATALQLPKRFFGSARATVEKGSLTIIATALTDTGSRMDEVIFEEFKGTGNAEIVLDRSLAEKRIFPALDIQRTGTRRENLLQVPEELARVTALRRVLSGLKPDEGLELLLQRLGRTPNNAALLMSMAM